MSRPHKVSRSLLSWASDIEPEALAQAQRASEMPFVVGHVALMPDAHLGLGATVGSVIPTRGAIMPAAVGVDIGCGMIAVETDLTATNLNDDRLSSLLNRIGDAVPAGVGKGHKHAANGEAWLLIHPNESVSEYHLEEKVVSQLGSLGSGNHFIEVCLDPQDGVWVVLHSGSRGVGNILARRHIDFAKGLMKRYFIDLPDPDLAYFTQGTAEFEHYMSDLMWAQDYARANRERMMNAVLAALSKSVKMAVGERRRINCHHNYTAMEHHHGKDMWVTRKGAIRARSGDYGVIPGSMGTSSFIVRGLGNPASFHSSAHGAGRRMSRRQARRDFTPDQLAEAMAGKTWLADQAAALLDEIPGSYKDIHQVMVDQADLVEVETELTQILNFKGT
jgi:RNA-splicing ligase RtcB